jgi:serine/threonine-protein kinase
MNDSRCIWFIKSRYNYTAGRQGILRMQGIPMLRKDQICVTDISGYHVVVDDFGRLSDADVAEFIKADIKILLLGAKDWELSAVEQVLGKVAEYKDIIYLFSYMDGRQFQLAQKHMDLRACHRIPYEPDPFASFKDEAAAELYGELAALCMEKSAVKENDKGEKKINAAE